MRAHVILPPFHPPPPFHFFPRTLREVSWTVPSTNQHCTPLAGRTYRENLETSPKHFPFILSLRRTHSYVSFNCGKLFLSPNPLGCLYRLERNVTLPRSFFFFFCSGNAETNAVKLEFYGNRIALTFSCNIYVIVDCSLCWENTDKCVYFHFRNLPPLMWFIKVCGSR